MIHKFKMQGKNIVVDVNSGAVHVVDDIVYDALDLYKKAAKEEIIKILSSKFELDKINESLEEIESLEKDGLLYSKDVYEDYIPLWDKKPVIKALCLHIAHDCNLRCKYCFASTGDFGVGRKLMDAETGKRAIDFVIRESGNRKNLEIDFFGGEPLMNFEAVKEIVEYAKEKAKAAGKVFRFTITTNALLLKDENIAYINENMHNVVLSIDGREATNDRMRYRVDGSGSYKDILPKIMKVAESRNQNNYYVRGTFTRENLDFSKDVLHLADLGFKQVSVEPVVAGKDSGYELREEDLATLYNEYEKLAIEYQKRWNTDRWFNFFHFMLDLSQGPCVAKRLGGCGAGHEYMAITPEGDIYPCHQFVGMENFKLGNVNNNDGFNSKIQQDFKNTNVYTKEECKKCWAKFYCSGGCGANAYQFNQDLKKPYSIGCELERKRVECALWLKAMEE